LVAAEEMWCTGEEDTDAEVCEAMVGVEMEACPRCCSRSMVCWVRSRASLLGSEHVQDGTDNKNARRKKGNSDNERRNK
jgi:hypothetical protein